MEPDTHEVGYPVLWTLEATWQRNVWHLTHEVSEFHLKDLCMPPRWFVEAFAQLCAFDLLGRLPAGKPVQTAIEYYGIASAVPDAFFSWRHVEAGSVSDIENYLKNVHLKDTTRTLYASALWLFVNAKISPTDALKFALEMDNAPAAEWRRRFFGKFGLTADITELLRAPAWAAG